MFGSTEDLRADGNMNGVVDTADYTVWRDNFGATNGGSASGTVPLAVVESDSFAAIEVMPIQAAPELGSLFDVSASALTTSAARPQARSLTDIAFEAWRQSGDLTLIAALAETKNSKVDQADEIFQSHADDPAATDQAFGELPELQFHSI